MLAANVECARVGGGLQRSHREGWEEPNTARSRSRWLHGELPKLRHYSVVWAQRPEALGLVAAALQLMRWPRVPVGSSLLQQGPL